MSTNTTHYGWLLPDDGQINWGAALRTFIDDVDGLLYRAAYTDAANSFTETQTVTKSGTYQLRLVESPTHYADFQVGSGGDLTIGPSGGDVAVSGNLSATTIQSTPVGSSTPSTGKFTTVESTGDAAFNTSSGNVNVGAALGTAGGKLNVTSTTEQLRLIYGSSVYAAFTVDSAGNLTVNTTGGVISPDAGDVLRSPTYTSGLIGWNISGAGDAEFNNLSVRGEIHTSVLTYGERHGLAGTFLVVKSAGKLRADVTTATSPTTFNVDIEDPDTGHVQLFASGDILEIKDGSGLDNWLTVSSVSDQTTFYRYVCTKSSGTNGTFRAGAAVFDWGPSGQGFVSLSADGGIGTSPNVTFGTHSGSPWSGFTLRGRLGNLNGAYGYATDVYGAGFGVYGAASNTWITVDATNGLRIGNNTSTKLQAKTNGDLELAGNLDVSGNLYAASRKIALSSSGFSSTAGTSDGNFYFMRHYNATPTEVANHQIYNNTGSNSVGQVLQTLVPSGSYTASTFVQAVGKDGSGTPLEQKATLGLSGGPTSVTSAYLEALRNITGGNVDSIRLTLAASSSGKSLELSTSGLVPGNAYLTVNDTAGNNNYVYPLYVNGISTFNGSMVVGAKATATSGKTLEVRGATLITTGGLTVTAGGLTVSADGATISGGMTVSGNATFNNNLAMAANQTINLSGGYINVGTSGAAAPSAGAGSGGAGAKLILFDLNSGSSVNYMVGVESGAGWISVPTTSNSFKIYGGTTLAWTFNGNGNGTCVGTLTQSSRRATKDGFEAFSDARALSMALALPPLETYYKRTDETRERHLSSMADDFHPITGLGSSEGIAPSDAAFLAIGAVRELARRVAQLAGAR